jgi:two-component system chemotaxis sensor kinase CheA
VVRRAFVAASIDERIHPPGTAAPEGAPESASASAAQSTATVRVRVERIDGLLEGLAGLLHAKSALDEAIASSPAADRMQRTALAQILRRLDSTIRSLQEDVLDVRLVAVGTLVPKLQRIAWSAAREAGKSVRLAADVRDVEVDKEIVDALVAPLAHLVRNAIDHGIEEERERRRLGKDPVGTIRIDARGEGAETIVEVVDDGSGIDLSRVLEKARRQGLLPNDRRPVDAEILEVLFAPGFTTRETVSTLSGRGVGLDAVRETIQRWGGIIEVETGAKGTRMRLRVPTTRAILSGLLVRAGRETYVLPLAVVAQVIKVRLADVEHRNGEGSLRRGGQTLPVLDLAALLGVGQVDPAAGLVPGVRLAGPGREAILLVDEVGARRDVVSRGLGLARSSIPAIVGTTEVGSGRTAYLLDPVLLTERRSKWGAPEEKTA